MKISHRYPRLVKSYVAHVVCTSALLLYFLVNSSLKAEQAPSHSPIMQHILAVTYPDVLDEQTSLKLQASFRQHLDEQSKLFAKLREKVDPLSLTHVWRNSSALDNLAYSSDNLVDPKVLKGGEAIYKAHRRFIALANEEVLFQTYVWESESEAGQSILQGLRDLEQRRYEVCKYTVECEPVKVRFVLNHGPVALKWMSWLISHKVQDYPQQARDSIHAMNLDPRLLDVEVLAYEHQLFGSNHSKTLIVDGQLAVSTGANAQRYNDRSIDWYDLGFVLGGDVVTGLRQDSINALLRARTGREQDVDRRLNQSIQKARSQVMARNEGLAYKKSFPTNQSLMAAAFTGPVLRSVPAVILTRNSEGSPVQNLPLPWLTTYNLNNNTQNRGFQAAMLAAESLIRIQTPNLNDDAALRSLALAARRGVRVELILSRYFNCTLQSAIGQGGPNARGLQRLRQMSGPRAWQNVDARWYARLDENGKPYVVYDNDLPETPWDRRENSHAKYLSIDGQLLVVGSANMDTQSWNHSREVNVAFDSTELTRLWDEKVFLASFDLARPVDENDLLDENINCASPKASTL